MRKKGVITSMLAGIFALFMPFIFGAKQNAAGGALFILSLAFAGLFYFGIIKTNKNDTKN